MTAQPDLFHPDQSAWVSDQLRQLDLKPGDKHYDNAVQAAEQGCTAKMIKTLISWDGRVM